MVIYVQKIFVLKEKIKVKFYVLLSKMKNGELTFNL